MRHSRRSIIFGCLLLAASASGEGWRYPEGKSVRIDTKVRFVDDQPRTTDRAQDNNNKHAHANPPEDEIPFKEPTNTEGFYNRPPGAGRYPVRVEQPRSPYRVNPHAILPVTSLGYRRLPLPPLNDAAGTLDSFKYCKCVNTPDCNPVPDTNHACGSGEYLCCYKKPTIGHHKNTEFFNEIEDERPVLYPNREVASGAFPPPPGVEFHGVFGNSAHEAVVIGTADNQSKHPEMLVGPGGPTGHLGPRKPINANYPPVLVGPDGPTGMIGPVRNDKDANPGASAQLGVLVGPGGPTGIIGPNRGVLVGPSGQAGIIGPNRGVLIGPGGPTGMIGPSYNRQSNPGILVGPGGPTGIIGPGRQLLVGPGGPTGYIGPRRLYDFSGLRNKAAINTALRNIEKKINMTRTPVTPLIRRPPPECKNKRESRCMEKKNRLERQTSTERSPTMQLQAPAHDKARKPRGIISDFIVPKFITKDKKRAEPTDFRDINDKVAAGLEINETYTSKETDHTRKAVKDDYNKKSQTKTELSSRNDEASTKTRQKRTIITKMLFPKIFENIEKNKEDPLISADFRLENNKNTGMFETTDDNMSTASGYRSTTERSNSERKNQTREDLVQTLGEASTELRQKRGIITSLIFPKLFKNLEKKKEENIPSISLGLAVLQLITAFY